jgi:GNAT superfamily N-acetyltransferase
MQTSSSKYLPIGLTIIRYSAVSLKNRGMDGATLSTVFHKTGAASLYLSSGGGIIGGGQHESVNRAAKKFVGFAIADLVDHNIWALFLLPAFEQKGIGRALHDTMLNWYFAQTRHKVWLSTSPGTRAEGFYRKAGWKEVGTYGKGEIKFEMGWEDWMTREMSPQHRPHFYRPPDVL